MTKELYNLHTEGGAYRITKFVDGEVESSYLLSAAECECPRGHHYTCRHRQMLPLMIEAKLVNTHWFWDFARKKAVDINGYAQEQIKEVEYGPMAQPEAKSPPRSPAWRRI